MRNKFTVFFKNVRINTVVRENFKKVFRILSQSIRDYAIIMKLRKKGWIRDGFSFS